MQAYKILLFSIILFMGAKAKSQTSKIFFVYDPAGNRTQRTYLPGRPANESTSINELQQNFSIKAFPNPTQDYVDLEINGLKDKSEKINVSIIDIQGKKN